MGDLLQALNQIDQRMTAVEAKTTGQPAGASKGNGKKGSQKGKGAGSRNPSAGTVRLPYWACPCGFSANFASNTACYKCKAKAARTSPY